MSLWLKQNPQPKNSPEKRTCGFELT